MLQNFSRSTYTFLLMYSDCNFLYRMLQYFQLYNLIFVSYFNTFMIQVMCCLRRHLLYRLFSLTLCAIFHAFIQCQQRLNSKSFSSFGHWSGSIGNTFDPIFIEIAQNVCFDGISDKFETRFCEIKNEVTRPNPW